MSKSGFFELLENRAARSLLCVGLDPRAKTVEEALNQCISLINATADHVACYKPNAAFFEKFGPEGLIALKKVIAHVPNDIPVILDAKRGDIAATAEAYATSAFDHLGAGAVTVSPYMGFDSLKPFVADRRHGVFALCKTSNPGSNDLQTLSLANSPDTLYERVARLAETKWNVNGNVGLVVGATDPEAIRRVRVAAPSLWFLVPGVGAQGGDLAESLKHGLRSDGAGVLINVSRAIAAAKDPAVAAKELNDKIQNIRTSVVATSSETLASALIRSQCARFGTFKLKSGLISPIYIDLRRLVTYPDVMALVAREYARVLNNISYDRLVGLPYAALPIATAVSMEVGKPMIYPRREAKAYGTRATIEGEFKKGERVVIIDDLVTTGETKIEAIDKLKSAGLEVVAIVVLIDREMGATAFLGKHGYDFRAVVNLTQLLNTWRLSKSITEKQFRATLKFMGKDTSKL